MDYDFRNRAGPPYAAQVPMYGQDTSSPSPATSHPMYGSSLYPRIGQPGHSHVMVQPPSRTSSYHQASSSSSSSSAGLGIKVVLKPEYRITPPPQLSPLVGDIPRSSFEFDFDFERRILAEAEKENQNWSKLGLENLPSKAPESTSSVGSNPVVKKYIASGLNAEAVSIAVGTYGDNPAKVQEFVNAYTLLREMGFSSSNVSEALLMFDNDTDKALAHFLNSPS